MEKNPKTTGGKPRTEIMGVFTDRVLADILRRQLSCRSTRVRIFRRVVKAGRASCPVFAVVAENSEGTP